MNVLIRCDASIQIGSGHVMRCLTIASNMRRLGHSVTFWMEPLPGHLIELVEGKGFSVIQQAQNVDILIVDHYGLDEQWESQMRAFARHIIVIDDLADRPHDCDLLLDQNVLENYENRYNLLVPAQCRKLLGPKYLIMRDEFIEARQQQSSRTGEVKRLLVFMGGSDPTNETIKVLQALQQTKTSFEHVDVVVGNSNPHREEIKKICSKLEYMYHCQISYMAKLMSLADFSIGAGGSTTWERCYVGVPSSSTIVADNQRLATEKADQLGAVYNLGWHEEVGVNTYLELLDSLPQLGVTIRHISEQGLKITESQGKPNAWLQEMVEWSS